MVIPEQGIDPAFVDRAAALRGVVIAVAAVLPVFLASALAVQIRGDLRFGTAAFGGIVAAYFFVSSAGAVIMGAFTQKIGPARGMSLACSMSAMAMLLAGLSRSWIELASALALAGLANAIAQPASNMLLSVSIPTHRLGLAFGIKQSCVPGAALISGLTVPTVALVLGWRGTAILAAVITAGYAGWLWCNSAGRTPTQRHGRGTLRESEAPISSLLFLTVGGFLGAAAGTSIGAFLPIAAVESGFSPSTAGWLYAAMAAGAIGSRIVLGWSVDRAPHVSRFGVIAALLGIGALGCLLLVTDNRALFVLGGSLGFVAGWGWTGVYHYTIVTWYRKAAAAATGYVQTGLSLGAGAGPLSFGMVAERYGYAMAWLCTAGVTSMAAITMIGARSHLRARRR